MEAPLGSPLVMADEIRGRYRPERPPLDLTAEELAAIRDLPTRYADVLRVWWVVGNGGKPQPLIMPTRVEAVRTDH